MKKGTKQVVILLSLFVLVVSLYSVVRIGIKYGENKEQAAEDAAKFYIGNVDDAVEVEFFNGAQHNIFRLRGEEWIYSADPNFPFRQAYMSTTLKTVSTLASDRTIDASDTIEAYGLNNGCNYMLFKMKNGSSLKLNIGAVARHDKVEDQDYYYAQVEGREEVYTIPALLAKYVSYDLCRFAELESVPNISADNIISYTFEKDGNTLALTHKDTYTTVTTTSETTGEETTREELTDRQWYVSWNGEEMPATRLGKITMYHMDTAVVEEMPATHYVNDVIISLDELSFKDCYAYLLTEEEQATYGLVRDDPEGGKITAVYKDNDTGEETEYVIYLGNHSEENGYYFFNPGDSTRIYDASYAYALPVLNFYQQVRQFVTGETAETIGPDIQAHVEEE